jgi:DNA topoisomerase I
VTINVGEANPIPKCPVPGHSWKNVITNNTATWLLSYKDEDSTFEKKDVKYVQLAANSIIKVQNDKKKYGRAARLYKVIDVIRQRYFKEMGDPDRTKS